MSTPNTEPPQFIPPPAEPSPPNAATAGRPAPSTPTIRFGVTATVRATQHQLPSSNRTNLGGSSGGTNVPPATNNNAGEVPQQTQNLFQMRDRLFLALFFRVSLIYARTCPKNIRRALEFLLLMQSIILLFILGYIHIVYTRSPTTCLTEYKDSWPKNGVLRVEITYNNEGYDLMKSYGKEERMRQRATSSQFVQYTDEFFSMMMTADSAILDKVVSTAGDIYASVTGDTSTQTTDKVIPTSSVDTEPPRHSSGAGASSTTTTDSSPPSSTLTPGGNSPENGDVVDESEANKKHDEIDPSQNRSAAELEDDILVQAAEGDEERSSIAEADIDGISPSIPITASGEGSSSTGAGGGSEGYEHIDVNNPDSPYFNKTPEEIEIMKLQEKHIEDDKLLNSSVTDYEMFSNSVWIQEQAYIVEYALEYGFLRLSPDTRQKLGIPVKLVVLDPSKETCFGDYFSLFVLENILGYDDILMSSIKNLAETEENKGYLRNVVTGEQFRFVPMWMARTSYIPALLIMLVFTVSISMLLRYSHHQIFVFIVDLLNNIEGAAGAIHIPAAPLFTVILALVGMEAIMSEFFNDSSTAFYVILIVWIADQYDAVCSHTSITKTFWVRFFYLYHFAFYAYSYRFNGQYGGLALLVSWSFIQHSMVFFYHHYELPAILRQAHQTHYPTRLPTTRQARGGSAPPDPTPSPAPHPNPEQSSVPPPPTNNPPLTTPTPSTPLISSSSPLSPTTRPHWSTSTRVAPVITETSSSSDVPLAPTIFNRVSPENVASLLLQNGRGGAESSPQDVAPTIFNHRGESSLLRAGQSGGGESNTACNRVSSGGVNNNECNPTPKVHHDVVVTQEETPLPPTSNPAQITTSPNFSESQSHHDQGNLGGVVNASGISSSGLLSPHQDGDGLRHRFPTSDAPADGEAGEAITTPRMRMTNMMEELD